MSRGKSIWLRRCCACAISLPLTVASASVFAQPPRAVGDAEISQLLRFRADHQHQATGMVVGVIRPSGGGLVAYGPTDARGARRLGGGSIFEIASLSKIFTALLL